MHQHLSSVLSYKRIFSCLGLLAFSFTGSYGQHMHTINRIGSKDFTGLHQLPGTPFLYTYYYEQRPDGSGKDKFIVEVLNDTLGAINHTEYELEQGAEIVKVGVSGPNFLLVVDNRQKKTRTYDVVNNKAERIQKTEETNLPVAFFAQENLPAIIPAMPEDFIIVSPAMKGKAQGYKISRIGREMTEAADQSFFPEGGEWSMMNVRTEGELISILRKEIKGNATEYALHILDPEKKTLATVKIADEENQAFGYPTFVSDQRGLFTIGGLYYKTSNIDNAKPAGIFAMQIGPSGDIQQTTKRYFGTEEQYDGIPRTLSRTMDGKTIIVSEQMKVVGQMTGTEAVSVVPGDFALDYFTNEGEYYKTEVIKKNAKTPGINIKGGNYIDIASYLSNNDHLSFQDIVRKQMNQYLMYKADGEVHFASIDSPAAVSLVKLPLRFPGRHEMKQKAMRSSAPLLEGVKYIEPGRLVLYNYSTPEMHIQMHNADSLSTTTQVKTTIKKNAGK